MGCPTSIILGNNLKFSICTHDPSTAKVANAASLPTYRVYEEEIMAPILAGTMARLDSVNTTGFYVETIACTSSNGFEAGKGYTVYIEATVHSTLDAENRKGAISYDFRVLTYRELAIALWSYILSRGADTLATAMQGDISIRRGDTMYEPIYGVGDIGDREKLWFTLKSDMTAPDADAVIQIEESAGLIRINGAGAGTPGNASIIVDDEIEGDIIVVVEAVETINLEPSSCSDMYFDIQVLRTGSSRVETLREGVAVITSDVTRRIV